jgi:copper chaperone CopZ
MQAKSTTYSVSGMHCGSCVAKVEKTLKAYAGNVIVSLKPPQAILDNSQADLATLNTALAAVGSYQLAAIASKPEDTPKSWLSTYQPLLLILVYLLLVTTAIQLSLAQFDGMLWMRHFMAGFFLVFSFFKLLKLTEFANSYAMYDLLAMRFKPYALVYPFLELGLGFAYLLNWQAQATNIFALVLMSFSSLGVIRAVINKQKIRCACLGSVFNLPMTTVTIVEDLLMALMAALMLL